MITPEGKQFSRATADESETLTIANPTPGAYTVVGHLYAANGGKDTGTLETLKLREDAGNLTVSPNPVPVTSGKATEATLSWSGLTSGTWKGLVTWDAGITTDVTVQVP